MCPENSVSDRCFLHLKITCGSTSFEERESQETASDDFQSCIQFRPAKFVKRNRDPVLPLPSDLHRNSWNTTVQLSWSSVWRKNRDVASVKASLTCHGYLPLPWLRFTWVNNHFDEERLSEDRRRRSSDFSLPSSWTLLCFFFLLPVHHPTAVTVSEYDRNNFTRRPRS